MTKMKLQVAHQAPGRIRDLHGSLQKIAKGHFTLRRLERTYGSANIRQHYATLAATRLPKIAG